MSRSFFRKTNERWAAITDFKCLKSLILLTIKIDSHDCKNAKTPSAVATALAAQSSGIAQHVGVFDDHSDVGVVLHKGSATYNAESDEYRLEGSGGNVRAGHDEFQFVWKKMKGDFIVQGRGVLLGAGTEPHRKYGRMIRSGLDSGSAMVCAALHGNGLASLQYRKSTGVDVQQDTFQLRFPDVMELERRGKQFIMLIAHNGEPYSATEVADIDLGDEVYVGLFVCAHNKNVMESRFVRQCPAHRSGEN